MTLYLKRLISSFVILVSFAHPVFAKVYVYEVITDERRFQTSSKLPPGTFYSYKGGYDVIKDLKTVKVYDDTERQKALEDFDLGENNAKKLLPEKTDNSGDIIIRYIWWR